MEPRFLSAYNLQQVLLSATLVSVVAIGQALVIIARQIDISVGPITAASAFISADFLAQNPSTPLLIIFLIGAAVGIVLGSVNAALVAGFGIPAIVATLGTFAMFRGGIIIFAEGRQISATSLPPNFVQLAEVMFLGLPLLVWVAVLFVIIFSFVLRFTRFGRNLYAIGSNPEGARLAGISEVGHVAAAFIICGLLSGLVGVLWSARFGTVHAAIAPNLHIDTILACVLGGISIFGGSGTIIGAVIGALIIAVLQNGVLLLGVSQFWIQAIIGAAIVLTVTFYSMISQRAETRVRRDRRRSRHAKAGGGR
jgi:rhamnose transport system permease protein